MKRDQGVCPSCLRLMAVTADGVIRSQHLTARQWPANQGQPPAGYVAGGRCDGYGRKAVPAERFPNPEDLDDERFGIPE